MSIWIALDIGHTTGMYVGKPLAEAPHIRYINSASLVLPLDELQEKALRALFEKADMIILENPVINRMSTMQKETKAVSQFWNNWASQFTVPIVTIQPALWKPFKSLAPENLIVKDTPISQHEWDAAHITWFWARRRNIKHGK